MSVSAAVWEILSAGTERLCVFLVPRTTLEARTQCSEPINSFVNGSA